ncbi:MAG: FtsX-like permease family protein [Ignisphaera sp.]
MVTLLTIVQRNFSRRKIRTVLTIIGISIGIGLTFSLLSITATGTQRSAELIRRLTGADITIYNATRGAMQQGFVGRRIGGFFPMDMPTNLIDLSIIDTLSMIPEIEVISPLLSFRAYLNSVTMVTVYGVDISTYRNVSNLDIVEGAFLQNPTAFQVIIGKSLSDDYNISVGDAISLQVGNSTWSFKVVGVFQSGERFQEYAVYIPIEVAQNITNSVGKASQIMIKLRDPRYLSDVIQAIQSSFPGLAVFSPLNMIQNVQQALNTITMFFSSIGLVAVTAGAFGVANTMIMSVVERTREIGILRAIGASRSFILMLFLLESFLIGFIGGVIGVLIGIVLSYIIAPLASYNLRGGIVSARGVFQQTFSVYPTITPMNIAIAILLGIVVGVVAGIYPAYRASKIKPVEALRYV